jgi:hypothetical protein
LTLDNLAKRYGCLPSDVWARADTLDLYVLDVSSQWSKHQNEQEDLRRQGKTMLGKKSRKPLNEKEMLEMFKKTRSEYDISGHENK